MQKAITKPGAHGMLYRYAITYTDRSDYGCGELVWATWAYNLEHAEEKFYANEEGWTIISLRRVVEGICQHEVPRHAPVSR